MVSVAISTIVGAALAASSIASAATISTADKGAYTLFDAAFSTAAPPSDIISQTNGMAAWIPPKFLPPGTVGAKPIPTNNWWGNMIAATTDARVEPVWTNPYAIRPSIVEAPYGLTASFPADTRQFYESTGNGANKVYASNWRSDITFSASQFTAAPSFQVSSWDDLSVTVAFTPSNGAGKMESTLTPGMATITARYTGLTPVFTTADAITSTDVLTGTRFKITLSNGQKWVLYTESTVSLTVSNGKSLVAKAAYTGYVRAALYSNDAQLAVLDKTAKCLLEGSNIEAKDATSYMFHLKTSGDCSAGLFHYLQIHQTDTLDTSSASIVSGVSAGTATRGPMAGVLTKTTPPVLRFTETQNVPVEFYPPRRPSASVVANQRIKEQLIEDINGNWSFPTEFSYYFFGKSAHKYANLCLMANDDSVSGSDKASLLRTCLDKLELLLQLFGVNKWAYPLQYDLTYKGLISSHGLSKYELYADFGNSIYNDHHYHYGYWIATAAILNYLDPSWSGLASVNRVASLMVRDVANPANSDPYFPKFRQFDWFRGHSYSHGVTPVTDGKDEESSSEDINFHYAMALFGKATGNAAIANVGQLLLKVNTRAVQTYFLLTSDNRVHPPSYLGNKVTGILFDNKVLYDTWFSPEKFAIHGIQMIPITPVTEFVRTAKFIGEEWDAVLSKIADVVTFNPNNSWLSLLYANYATVNKVVALEKLQSVAMDDGLSRSWALYMAATRTGVDPTPGPSTPAPSPGSPSPPSPPTTTPEPVPTTPAPTTPASGAQCGNAQSGPLACPTGEYCQPWNPTSYQCRKLDTAKCGAQLTGVDFYGDDLATVQVLLPELCCDKCVATAGCKAYTFVNYNADGKAYCYLKKGSGTRKSAVGAVSAVIAVAPVPTTPAPVPTTTAPVPTTPAPVPTTTAPVPTTTAPVPTTTAPVPTTTAPVPTTPAPTTPASGAQCGNAQSGPLACPSGEYCQPWNPTFYQCRKLDTAKCGAQLTGVDFYGDDLATVQVLLPEQCCDRCVATAGCKAYTFVNYNADGKAYCYLKKGTGMRQNAVGVVSAVISGATTPAPVPTTSVPVPTTSAPVPTTVTPPGGSCGSQTTGASACPNGQYCQPWNPTSYQCRTAPALCGTQQVGVDFYGADLKTIESILPEDCCNQCAATAGCKAYTFVNFNANGKSACYLKSGTGERRVNANAVSSTVLAPKAKCTFSTNVDFYGNDLATVYSVTADECCDKCASTSRCAAFTLVNEGSRTACYLKTSTAGRTTLTGATSGALN